MSLMLRRFPATAIDAMKFHEVMAKVEGCTNCGRCKERCPYRLDVPNLLKRNYEDFKQFTAAME